MWPFKAGMFFIVLLQIWHCKSCFSMLSALAVLICNFPCCCNCALASPTSMKKVLVKEFQCFLCFRAAESKSCNAYTTV